MLLEIQNLVEDIIKYTKKWSISETEWYWNIECCRKPNNINEKNISWEEFEVAIREEMLYDLIYHNGIGIENQMNNDYCNYGIEYDGKSQYADFLIERYKLEQKIKGVINDFKLYWEEETLKLYEFFKEERTKKSSCINEYEKIDDKGRLLKIQSEKDYNTMCIFYLGIQIMGVFKVKFLCIDFYYDKIKEIYEDYKKYDNGNKSLLDSVNDYIDNNKQEIYEKVKHCFE